MHIRANVCYVFMIRSTSSRPNHQFHRVQPQLAVAALAMVKAAEGTRTKWLVGDYCSKNSSVGVTKPHPHIANALLIWAVGRRAFFVL
jgi:hypothetical protein